MDREAAGEAKRWCSFCPGQVEAEYDFKTQYGPWAYGCRDHWVENRMYPTLGVGKGQALDPSKCQAKAAHEDGVECRHCGRRFKRVQ